MTSKKSARLRVFRGAQLEHIAFPLGGIGAGMICLQGCGAIGSVSIRHRPELHSEPLMFAALAVRSDSGAVAARVLEGPVPKRKISGFTQDGPRSSASGLAWSSYGLPRFEKARFEARFPFGHVQLRHAGLPVRVEIVGWSPFVPLDEDASSLPVAAVDYVLKNESPQEIETVVSFQAANFVALSAQSGGSVRPIDGGFVLSQPPAENEPWKESHFAAFVRETEARSLPWFRGGWFDGLTTAWRDASSCDIPNREWPADGPPPPGAGVFVPVRLKGREKRAIRLHFCWHTPRSSVRHAHGEQPAQDGGACGCGPRDDCNYRPWYATRFKSIDAVVDYWRANAGDLLRRTRQFTECFFDTTLPPVVVEAVAANLSILKSPTILRQADGRLWAYEGCHAEGGCCHGSCTHVWNYAQAIPHLFPTLERTLRQTEFGENQHPDGLQVFRANLPVSRPLGVRWCAADGQLGGILKVYRDWRVSGDAEWLRALWPRVKASIDYCIAAWDPDRLGCVREPHHNTYDIEFWGPDGLCTSYYVGALAAAVAMARALGEEAQEYETLHERACEFLQTELFKGGFFIQRVEWKNLRAEFPGKDWPLGTPEYSPESLAILEREGPKYQYGAGCLSDGALGLWHADLYGLDHGVDRSKVEAHLLSVHRHNLRRDCRDHENPQRPGFALGDEGGLLLCTWPNGGKPSLPFPYSDEVWTGIEYQVASHLALLGHDAEALDIVEIARRRYDGTTRNPFAELECGYYYARALSSYALLQAFSGARYDAVGQILRLSRPAKTGDFRAFICTSSGYGTVGVRDGKAFLDVRAGAIPVREIRVAARA